MSRSTRTSSSITRQAVLTALIVLAALVAGVHTAAAQPPPDGASPRIYLPTLAGGVLADAVANQYQVQPAAASPTGATIASDQADYPPGALVTLTGTGWQANEAVHIIVNDDGGQSWSLSSDPDPVADAGGNLTYSFQLPNWFVANYGVSATGPDSGQATTTFTDLSIGTYDQCANDDQSVPPGTGYTTGDLGCRWINGNLQSNTAYYAEGDATVQRVWLTDFPSGLHTLTLQYGTTKGGKHAYDFLTTWNWSENWITEADLCQGITGCVAAAASENGRDIPQDPNVPDSFEPSAPGARQFIMRGGTLTSVTTPVIASGSYAGDSETNITVSFIVPSSGPMCNANGCSVALWFGAHVSAQANWGLGQGAGSISGSPYHVALDAVDSASVGQRDNQMQANVISQIPNGTIVVIKDAVPNDAQDFSFNLNNNSTISQDFSLDDDADGTLPNSQTFSVPPGAWTTTELNIPSGWSLTNLVCVDPTNNTTVNGAVASINLASSETVTCTYTDSRNPGSLKISKSLSNPGNATVPASFTINYDCGTGYTGSVAVAAGGSQTVSGIPSGRQCTVSEPALTPIPGFTWGTPVVSGSPATIGTGTTVEVTVANSITRDTGTLTIAKTLSNPDNAGVPASFTINYDCGTGYTGSVAVAPGGSQTVSGIPTGNTCTVSEAALAPIQGFTWGTPSVAPASVVIGTTDGTFTLTVANSITRDLGSLVLAKSLSGGPSGYTGPFTINYDCDGTAYDGSVSVSAGGSQTVSNIPTGTSCTVSETLPNPPAGYSFGTPAFSPSDTVVIPSGNGSSVTVMTNNTLTFDTGSLKILKTLSNPDNAGVPASFTINYDCGGGYTGNVSVAAGGSQTVSGIPTGSSCTVSEPALTPISGYTWGTPSVSGSPATIGKNTTVEVTVANSISRDLGSLVLAKSLSGGPGGYTGPFTINYDCGTGYQGSASVAAGGSKTVSGIPTGKQCTVSETLPTPPTGYSFGTPTFSPQATVTIPDGNGSSVTVTTNNTLTRDTGSLQIAKTLSNPDGANVPSSFTVNYSCDDGTSGSKSVAPGSPATVSGIPTGSTCTVTEVAPAAISGYTWGAITYSPTSIVISSKGGTFTITVGNSITRDRGSLTIVKNVVNDNGGTATVSAFGLNTNAGSLTFDGGVANGTTTTYTSQKITVATGAYTLKESDVYGYTEGAWSCTNGTANPTTYNSGSVKVDKDKDVVCTITNDDQPGTIIVIKNAKPAQGSFAFATTGTGYTGFTLTGATTNNGNRNSQTLNAGTYTVKESTQLAWILTGIGGAPEPNMYNCVVSGSGGSTGAGDLNTQTATISLKNGDTVTCTFENTGLGVTRTQGFWATHPQLAQIAWFGGTAYGHTFPGVVGTAGIGDTTLCGRPIDSVAKLMGGFWSDISKKTTGAKRSSLDQARMQLLQQMLAAELNASAFGSVPSSGTFLAWEAAYCGTNTSAISKAQQQSASFNTAGDSGQFTPGTSADSKGARSIANKLWWDALP